jgi:Spy/CpxP family protein refolding chaperone
MKKTILATVMALTVGSTLFAQGPGRPDGRRGTPPTAEEMVERRVEMLTDLLTLDSAQQQQATKIFTDEATASQALRQPTQTAHEALQTAVKSGAADAQIDQLSTQIGTLAGQNAAIHAKAQSKFRLILNSAQKEKLDSRAARRGRGMGGPGGFGGPQF